MGSGAANFGKLWAGTAAARSPPGRRTSQLHVARVWPGGLSLWRPASLCCPSLMSATLEATVHVAAVHSSPLGTVHPAAWSEPWPPTQISSPSNHLPLNGEVAKRGSALLRVETVAQPSGRAPPVPPQACKRRTPGLRCSNRVCCSRSASLEDLWPQIPPAPPCPCWAPCALRVSPHRLIWGTQHCATRCASLAPRAESSWAGWPASTRQYTLLAHSHLLPLCLAISSASCPKLSACSKTSLPRSLSSTLQTPSNNRHRNLTTSATEGCTAGLSGPFTPCPFFSWCVGYQPLNAQITPDSPSRLASTSNQLSPGCPTSRTLPGHGTQRPPRLLALASSTWVLPLAQ